MPRNGSGVAMLPANSFNPAVVGEEATAVDWNETAGDIEAMLTSSIASNGVTTPTTDLPMGGFRHLTVGAATARSQYLRADQGQDSTTQYAVASGTDTYTATLSPAIASYVNGQTFRIRFTNANTGAATLNLNSVGARALQRPDGAALISDDIPAASVWQVMFNASAFTIGSNSRVDLPSLSSTPIPADPSSGYFGTYETFAATMIYLTQAEVQADDEDGGWRSALALYHQDNDITDYEIMPYRTISDALRVSVFGKNDGAGTYTTQYKDLHAITAAAVGRVEWDARGVAAFSGESVQFGEGVCLNEFTVSNPAGSPSQTKHMSGLLLGLYAKQAAADATHRVIGLEIINAGKLATTGIEIISDGTDGDNGQFDYALKANSATVAVAALFMPASASGDVGTRILYDTGDLTEYERTANQFNWYIGANKIGRLSSASFTFVSGSGNADVTILSGSTAEGGYIITDGLTFVALDTTDAAIGLTLGVNGTAKITLTGTSIGFFNNAGVAKQTITGSRGGNAALASLLTALAGHNLITDSTSA